MATRSNRTRKWTNHLTRLSSDPGDVIISCPAETERHLARHPETKYWRVIRVGIEWGKKEKKRPDGMPFIIHHYYLLLNEREAKSCDRLCRIMAARSVCNNKAPDIQISQLNQFDRQNACNISFSLSLFLLRWFTSHRSLGDPFNNKKNDASIKANWFNQMYTWI